MSGRRYDVIFSGKLVEGAALDKVKANVARLFKVEVAKVEPLFRGAPMPIKKGVDEQTAKKYLMAMKKAGAICAARVSATKPVAAKPAAAASSRPVRPSAGGKVTAPAATPAATPKSVVKQPPQGLGELGSASLDEVGTVLVEHREVAPPKVDTSGLSMDEVGSTLVEHQPVPAPQVDTSGLSVDAPGATLVEHEEPQELKVDLSGLSMDEPGATIMEHEEEAEPAIDTSKLSLS